MMTLRENGQLQKFLAALPRTPNNRKFQALVKALIALAT